MAQRNAGQAQFRRANGGAIQSRKPVHIPDMLKDKAYLEGHPLAVSVVNIAGIRTLFTVPMLRGGEAIGVVTIYRKDQPLS